MSETVNIVTAVSRPDNLRLMRRSIVFALNQPGCTLRARWYLVIDEPCSLPEGSERLDVSFVVADCGPCRYGILQKNRGIDCVKDGWYYCLDDDNILHPRFFIGVELAMELGRGAGALVFGQQRWDGVGDLVAASSTFLPGHVDNSMFLVRRDLIGDRRYNLAQAGYEDYHFFKAIYDAHPTEFVFLPDQLAYYNYLRHHKP